ncbi:4Fe-4S binding protein [Nocardia stercoris]|uniref:(4Fe-4S)-binding protein n=1 Tax=Nocardia stercoris TaxID=2483361 RepID=A0A3M2KX43_9NOCA|nr:4Fe-4S binding protein [Nocardia stercoris]RMI30112.1 (4Fe-4S)-binding protein [Nocardia stercoris]
MSDLNRPERQWNPLHVPVRRGTPEQPHPTVAAARAQPAARPRPELDADWLRELCLAAGVDDVGFVALETPGLEGERDYVREALPGTRALIGFCLRTSRDNLQSRSTSAANRDVATTQELAHEAARRICLELQRHGVRALYPASGLPAEIHRFPERSWVVSHKLVAVAAGLGQMGLHRNVIHPKFGTFVVLGTILLDRPVTRYAQPVASNPCIDCGLCVTTCPVGAIHADGGFDFDACYTHNNHHELSNFAGWVEEVVDSADAADYRRRVTPSETLAVWQSLSFQPQFRAGYCVAVCPAGSDVVGAYLTDPEAHARDIVEPLRRKPEYVYVDADSAAAEHVRTRFPHKVIRHPRRVDVPEPALDPVPEHHDE